MFGRLSPAPLSKAASCRNIPQAQKVKEGELRQPENKEEELCLKNIPEEEETGAEEGGHHKGIGEGRGGRPVNLWGIGWKSEADLPASVADCFEDPSLLASLQARLLTLLGRASRYDLATAAHMDALDLASVGITEPLHRMAIKFEFDLVKRPPPVPDEVPETCEEWLASMGLEDYVENFHQNGIYCPLAALGLTKRDLQVMGIYMLGHRKRILLAILGLKESLLRRE